VTTAQNDAWQAWLAEARQIMRVWKLARGQRLTGAESADLVGRMAAALQAAAQRTKSYWGEPSVANSWLVR
jgi:hypothetical protein